MLHKVRETVLPIGLSASIPLPDWCAAIYIPGCLDITWMLWSQPCIISYLRVPGRGR